MHLFWPFVVGIVIGLGAGGLAPDKVDGDLAATALLGIVGALLADALARTPGLFHPGDSLPGIIGPVLGAVVALAGHHVVLRRTRRRTERGPWNPEKRRIRDTVQR
jgi:uncharacterized membrane protein YeaQ/YmgE (transglycosylase-associated protein family)